MITSLKLQPSIQAEYIRDVNEIVKKASDAGVQLRAVGGVGVMAHCAGHLDLLEALKREPSDIDFIASSRQERKVDAFFKDLGYTEKGGQGITMEVWTDRRIFEHPTLPHVDVFFDGLDFCHKIDYRKRLTVDNPTMSAADLMLGKLQIVEINEKDLQDVMVLNLEHRLSDGDNPETINVRYLTDILSQDWGFYFTFVTNLKKAKKLLERYHNDVFTPKRTQRISGQIDELIGRIDAAPKSLRWKARAKVGTRLKWYKNPGEEYREAVGV